MEIQEACLSDRSPDLLQHIDLFFSPFFLLPFSYFKLLMNLMWQGVNKPAAWRPVSSYNQGLIRLLNFPVLSLGEALCACKVTKFCLHRKSTINGLITTDIADPPSIFRPLLCGIKDRSFFEGGKGVKGSSPQQVKLLLIRSRHSFKWNLIYSFQLISNNCSQFKFVYFFSNIDFSYPTYNYKHMDNLANSFLFAIIHRF